MTVTDPNPSEPGVDDAPVVARYKDDHSRFTSTTTIRELLEKLNEFIPVDEIHLQTVSPEGDVILKRVASLSVDLKPTEPSPRLPSSKEAHTEQPQPSESISEALGDAIGYDMQTKGAQPETILQSLPTIPEGGEFKDDPVEAADKTWLFGKRKKS